LHPRLLGASCWICLGHEKTGQDLGRLRESSQQQFLGRLPQLDRKEIAKYMGKHYVRVECDVHMSWRGDIPPIYRAYINDELLTERTFIWQNACLEEQLQLQVDPGTYELKFELLDDHGAEMRIENVRVTQGPAGIKKGRILRVYDEVA
jgi:hypothetical protein